MIAVLIELQCAVTVGKDTMFIAYVLSVDPCCNGYVAAIAAECCGHRLVRDAGDTTLPGKTVYGIIVVI